jgi:hypothetical protein
VADTTGVASMRCGRGRARCCCAPDSLLLSTGLLRMRTSPSGHPSPLIRSTAAFTQSMGHHSIVPQGSVLWPARQEDSRDSCFWLQVGAAIPAASGCFNLLLAVTCFCAGPIGSNHFPPCGNGRPRLLFPPMLEGNSFSIGCSCFSCCQPS